jgi:hypothetical protein
MNVNKICDSDKMMIRLIKDIKRQEKINGHRGICLHQTPFNVKHCEQAGYKSIIS